MTKPATQAWSLILAAGQGSRLASAGQGRKQYLPYRGAPLFWHSARALASVARVRGIVFVFPPGEAQDMAARVAELDAGGVLGLPWKVAAGGVRRQDSVRGGLAALPPECDAVLVHDAARPFASPSLIRAVIAALEEGAVGAIPALPVTDTIKELAPDGRTVAATPDRALLRAVQTPQGFVRASLEEAHRRAEAEGWDVTDDASMLERLGLPVVCVPGEEGNVKITNPEDLRLLEGGRREIPCLGWGYDVHRYGGDRPMMLGGVAIPKGPLIVAHSDGDVLLHALMDAILGCCALGDIGRHFPDTDPKYAGISSAVLLKEVLVLAREQGLSIQHVDLTVIAQVPKCSPHARAIQENVANLLEIPASRVNFKATTEEGLGFTGEKRGIKAVAAVTGLRVLPEPGEAGA